MQSGAPVVAVRAISLDDITTGIRLMGQIIEDAAPDRGAASKTTFRGLAMSGRVLIIEDDTKPKPKWDAHSPLPLTGEG